MRQGLGHTSVPSIISINQELVSIVDDPECIPIATDTISSTITNNSPLLQPITTG